MCLKHTGTNNWRHTPAITQLEIIKQHKNDIASRLKGLLAAPLSWNAYLNNFGKWYYLSQKLQLWDWTEVKFSAR